MKHLVIHSIIISGTVVLSILQYFLTDIPGYAMFMPMYIAILCIRYLIVEPKT